MRQESIDKWALGMVLTIIVILIAIFFILDYTEKEPQIIEYYARALETHKAGV